MSAAAAAQFAALLRQGEQLQQRAERRRGAEAAQLFSEAVVRLLGGGWGCAAGGCTMASTAAEGPSTHAPPPPPQAKYKAALELAGSGAAAPPAADYAAAWFGAAESLQEGAEATLAAAAQLPDEQLTAQAAAQADAQAEALLQESVAAYQRVLDGGQPRVDALVCGANALSTWAEVAARRDPAAAAALLEQAADGYRSALAREEDALTLSNLADCLVQRGALLCEAGQGGAGGAVLEEAMAAYQRACGLSDAADGDDLPGLLLNWARGLLAAAQQAQARAVWLGGH